MTSTPGEAAFAEAAAMVSAGDLAGAEARLRECLALRPDHQNAELTLANLLLRRRAWLEAEPVLRAHLKRAPTVDGFLMLASVLDNTGRILEAERCYLDVLKQVPDNTTTVQSIANFYGRNDARREAVKYWQRYRALAPDDVAGAVKYADAIGADSPDEAIAALEKMLTQVRGDDARTMQILEKLILLKEWRARAHAGLPLYHGVGLDDLHFRFTKPDVGAFYDVVARVAAARPTDVNVQTKLCYALFATGAGADLARHLAPVAENIKGHPWSNVRDRASGFYQRIFATAETEMFQGLPPVETILANTFAVGPVAFLSCDFRYFAQFAVPLLRSLAANAPGAQVHIHIMDAPQEQTEAAKVLVERLGLRAAITRETLPSADRATPERERAYFHAIRFVRFYQQAVKYGHTMWMMDVDALFNRDPAELYAHLGEADIALRVRPARWEPWNQFSACAVAATPTPRSLVYFRAVAGYIAHFHRERTLAWGIDQTALYGVFDFLQSQDQAPAVAVLGPDAVSLEASPSGVLWCTAGFRKFAREKLTCRDPDADPYALLFERYSS